MSFSLEVNIEQAYRDVRRLQALLYRTLGLLHRISGDEDLASTITQVQQLIAWLNTLRLTIAAVQAASGPIGWGLALVGIGETLLTGYEIMEYERRGHAW